MQAKTTPCRHLSSPPQNMILRTPIQGESAITVGFNIHNQIPLLLNLRSLPTRDPPNLATNALSTMLTFASFHALKPTTIAAQLVAFCWLHLKCMVSRSSTDQQLHSIILNFLFL